MRTFGIIGYPLSHSFSHKYFTDKFTTEKITDAVFENFPIQNILLLPNIIAANPTLHGLAVTIPYKKEVLSHLDESTEEVKQIGASNCVRLQNNKLFGYNTDVVGFEKSFIKHLKPHHTKALILGTGGAASAVEFVLQKLNIPYKCVSRTAVSDALTYDQLNHNVIQEYSIIINSTPLGTFPNTSEAPAIPYHLITSNHYLFDLVYNPPLTKFLEAGKDRGAIIQNGYEMLVIQAEENWKIWNS